MKRILQNANVLTMEGPEIKQAHDLLFEDGKIKNIAKGISTDGANIINCTGKYIMPALFDMHVHLNSTEMMPLFMANGVTSVRSMWGFPIQLQWNEQVKKGELLCPYIYSTGPLTDGLEYWKGSVIVTTSEEAEAAVLKDIKDGFLCFKAYPSIPKDAFLHLLAVAKRENFKVVGHGNSFLSWKTLSDFGYYCCEHSNTLPEDESDIVYMAKSGMWLCPTHTVVKTIEDYLYQGLSFEDYKYRPYVTGRTMKEWDDITTWRLTTGKHEFTRQFVMQELINRAKLFIENAGVEKIILGTDTPNPGVVAGFPIFDELCHLVYDYGLSNFDALKTGTVNGAVHLGIEKQKGMLAEGFDADIIILDADPLADIKNMSKLNTVIPGGRIHDRAALDAILEKARNLKDEDIKAVV